MKVQIKKFVPVHVWNEFVREVYGRSYKLESQEHYCNEIVSFLTIPTSYDSDDDMNDSIKEIVQGLEKGVKFKTWLSRDPLQPLLTRRYDEWELETFWEENFYPDLQTLANDLYKKNKLDSGEYIIYFD